MIRNSKSCVVLARIMLVTVSAVAVLGYPLWREWRQQKYNRDLIAAIKASRPDEVVSLLELGADPNGRDVRTPRTLMDTINVMLRRKPVEPRNSDTAILIALNPQLTHDVPPETTSKIVKALADKGADVNAANQFEGTPLTMVFWGYSLPNAPDLVEEPEEHIEWERILLDAGADVNASNVSGWTPLMHAAHLGYIDSARLLLKRGADPNIVAHGSSPDTALSMAKLFDYARIAKLITAHGGRR